MSVDRDGYDPVRSDPLWMALWLLRPIGILCLLGALAVFGGVWLALR